ncbi:MAG: hypothetical protein J6P61_03805 [Erysipelotrichaceae bacterium]|nr:hypothetical protein [Erysipelotrichaceae bacterium]
METIRNYLDAMFAQYAPTPNVIKAKHELEAMMEDKYTELRADGTPENEAIAIVISEFGNLEDLAEDLGLKTNSHDDNPFDNHILTVEQIDSFIADSDLSAKIIAIGVMLCILSPVGAIIADIFDTDVSNTIGAIQLFCCIAAAVACFVYNSYIMKKWKFMEKEGYTLVYGTQNYVESLNEGYAQQHVTLKVVGIALCILCIVPPIIMDLFHSKLYDSLGGALLFTVVAFGVGLLVYNANHQKAYDTLLSLNAKKAGTNKVHYDDPLIDQIMSVYWQTVLAFYLMVSFWTFRWFSTWRIWILAVIIHFVIEKIYGGKKDE